MSDFDSDEAPERVGAYRVTSVLGSGMSGVVLAGIEPSIGKRVALKVLRRAVSDDPDIVARFLREARTVNEVRHRGIIDIFGVGTLNDGRHYLVMELLEGRSLEQILQEQQCVAVEVAIDWAAQILEALSAAHSAGVIHRDIKPSNLFSVEQGRYGSYVKLLDFGIAKLMPSAGHDVPQTQAEMIMGTPDYMAPEQIRSLAVTPSTDLYALGCVLFHLLSGRRPFEGGSIVETMALKLEMPAPRLGRVSPGAPSELGELLEWMMEREPAHRPASADVALELVEQLRRSFPLRRAPVSTPRASLPTRVAKPRGAGATAVQRPQPPSPGRDIEDLPTLTGAHARVELHEVWSGRAAAPLTVFEGGVTLKTPARDGLRAALVPTEPDAQPSPPLPVRQALGETMLAPRTTRLEVAALRPDEDPREPRPKARWRGWVGPVLTLLLALVAAFAAITDLLNSHPELLDPFTRR